MSEYLLGEFRHDEDVDASLDPQAGGTANGKPIWTVEQVAAYLNRTGGQWGTGPNDLMPEGGNPNVITYGFHENQQSLLDNGYIYRVPNAQGVPTLYAFSEYFNFQAFNQAQRDATREAMQNWDDVVAVSFVETHANQGDINFGNLASAPQTQAYSRIPTAGYGTNFNGAYGTEFSIAGYAADIWVSASQPSNFQFDEGLYGLNTLVHEIGHSLGLSHPGNYNFAPGFAVNYINGAEYAQDARNYAIMSYWNPRDMGSTATGVPTRDFDWSLMSIAYGSTPMIHDIAAVQVMYGADMTTRTGDTTYGFNSNAGRDHYDFTKTPWPTMTIWDAGGNDTLDASGYKVTQVIDLTPGSLSSIGGITYEDALAQLTFEQVNANRVAAGYTAVSKATYDANMAAFAADPNWRGRLTDNVGIAYGAVIENAKGGSGNDAMIGNHVGNTLEGNAGDDALFGRDGNDFLIGGTGADVLDGGDGTDTVSYAGASGRVVIDLAVGTASGADGADTISFVENAVGSAHADRIIGNAGANTIRSGDGVDVVSLGGGADTFVAEQGTKTASKAGNVSFDVITDFAKGSDKIDLGSLPVDFVFRGTDANKLAGDLSYKVYTSVNGAENALGFDIDGLDGAGVAGPVTVVYANVDGGSPDVGIILLNTNGVSIGDFLI